MATKRTYGKERTLGDIIYNPHNKTVFTSINLGFFGKKSITLVKKDDGSFDLMVSKYNSEELIQIGRTFPAKDKNGNPIEGITQGTLGLLKRYDSELKKEITDNSDALFITTHKLKETKALGDSGLIKVGYIKGKFGIEIEANTNVTDNTQSNTPEIDIDEDEIPF